MSELQKEVESPCIGVCGIDDLTGYCEGCFRTLEEIEGWWDLDNDKKQAIVDEASARESAAFE